jgi:hypothetical protein
MALGHARGVRDLRRSMGLRARPVGPEVALRASAERERHPHVRRSDCGPVHRGALAHLRGRTRHPARLPGACRELALALGGKKCIYLADSRDDHETGATLDDFEASLLEAYPPVASLEALHEGDDEPDKWNVNLASYYIDRFV